MQMPAFEKHVWAEIDLDALQLMKRDDFLARIKLIANDKLTPHKRA